MSNPKICPPNLLCTIVLPAPGNWTTSSPADVCAAAVLTPSRHKAATAKIRKLQSCLTAYLNSAHHKFSFNRRKPTPLGRALAP